MILDVSENATLGNDSFDSWSGYMFDDDAVIGSSPFRGSASEPTRVGLDVVDEFKCESAEFGFGFEEEV